MFSYQTSLPANPINTAAQQTAAMGQFAPHQYQFPGGMAPGAQIGGAAQNQLAQQLSGLTNNANASNAVQYGRGYNAQNNPWMLQQQIAQNSMGQQGVQQDMNLQSQNFDLLGQRRNLLFDAMNGTGALGGLLGGY